MKKTGKLWLPDDDDHFAGQHNYQQGHRDHSLSYVKQHREAIDVGAHIGTWSVDLVKIFQKVHAFEPIQKFRSCLIANVPSKNLILYPHVLGDIDGGLCGLKLNQKNNSGTMAVCEGIDYTIRTLDSFELTNIDYIKIDVEGYELSVLKGAEKILLSNKPVINIELKEELLIRYGVSSKEIVNYLASLGAKYVGKMVEDCVFMWD